jgi:hypothetical protein
MRIHIQTRSQEWVPEYEMTAQPCSIESAEFLHIVPSIRYATRFLGNSRYLASKVVNPIVVELRLPSVIAFRRPNLRLADHSSITIESGSSSVLALQPVTLI